MICDGKTKDKAPPGKPSVWDRQWQQTFEKGGPRVPGGTRRIDVEITGLRETIGQNGPGIPRGRTGISQCRAAGTLGEGDASKQIETHRSAGVDGVPKPLPSLSIVIFRFLARGQK